MSDRYLKSLLGENEEVLFVTHHHWLVLFGEILAEVLIALVVIVLVSLVWATLTGLLIVKGTPKDATPPRIG